jgi:hypothetical protein
MTKDEKMNPTTKSILRLARAQKELRSAIATQLHSIGPRDFTLDPGSQQAMLRRLMEGDNVRVTYWLKADDEPEREEEVVVLSAWDPMLPGVGVRGSGDVEGLLVDGGPDEGCLYQPTTRGPAHQVRRLSLVKSRVAADKTAAGTEILGHMGGMKRLASVLGARNFRFAGAAVSFEWPAPAGAKGNKIRIARMPSGGFAVSFVRRTNTGEEQAGRYREVPAKKLAALFERHTGWVLAL